MGGPLQNHLSIFQWELPAHLPQVDGQIVEQRGIHSLLQLGAARETPPVGCLAVLGPSPPPPPGETASTRGFFLGPGGSLDNPPNPGGPTLGVNFGSIPFGSKENPNSGGVPPRPDPQPPLGRGGTPPLGNCLQTTSVSTEAGKRCQEGGGRGHLWIPCGHRRLEIHVFLIKKPENKTPFFQVGIFQDCQGLNTGAGLIYF